MVSLSKAVSVEFNGLNPDWWSEKKKIETVGKMDIGL